MISCPCGKKMCRQCVEQIKKDNKPCPFCNKNEFTFLWDYGLERSLKELVVYCSHKKDGCEWRGKLGEYDKHLNEDVSQENQLTGCQFVEVYRVCAWVWGLVPTSPHCFPPKPTMHKTTLLL